MNHDESVDRPLAIDSEWLRRVQIIERFEERWQQTGSAPIAEFLAAVEGPERLAVLRELIKVDLEYRWKRGERRLVEDYAREFTELGSPANLPADLILEERRVREYHGCPVTPDEICLRFPGREVELIDSAQTIAQTSESSRRDVRPTVRADGSNPALSGTNQLAQGKLGHYELRGSIGRGGFATVYRAWDVVLQREVAIKVSRSELLLDAGAKQRVLREAQSAARLRHPGIVQIHEVGEHDGAPYIVYALLPGPTLALYDKSTTPSPRQAALWTLRIAEALEYAHQAGIIHRDVKPTNILLDHDGQPALADFGLALDASNAATLTQHGDILGTPAYMSPEQAAGRGHEVDGRTDVYGLGVVLYELLCGHVPFEGSGASVLHRVIHEEPRPPRQLRGTVPIDLETICLKAMAKEPARRYATAGAMASDLRAYVEHRPIQARRIGPLGQLALWCRRNPNVAATIAVALAIIITVTAESFRRVVAERNRFRANLYESLVGETRAIRLARGTGFRDEAWDRLKRAKELDTPVRNLGLLRQEATACLGDFVGQPPVSWKDLNGVAFVITALAFHPNQPLSVVGFADGVVVLRDVAAGSVVAQLERHESGVFAVAFSRSGRVLCTMDDRGVMKIWKCTTPQGRSWNLFRTIQTKPSAEPKMIVAVWCAIASDEQHIFACSKGEALVTRWNIETGEVSGEFRGSMNELFVRGALSPDGRTLIGAWRGSDKDGIVIWDTETKELRKTLVVTRQAIIDTAFSGDGRFLACGCNVGTFVLDTTDWQQRMFVRGDDQFFTIAFHPDRPLLAVPVSRSNAVRLWDVVSNREVATLKHPGGPHSVTFSPDGTNLASATGGEIRSWNLLGSGERRILAGHLGQINNLQFSPDGKILASAGRDGSIKLWDAPSGRILSSFSITPTPVPQISGIAFHPDSQRLALGDWFGNVAVFDIRQPDKPKLQKHLVQLRELGHIVFDVRFSPDGRYLAAAGQNGIWLWQDDQRIAVTTDKDTGLVQFTADSQKLVSLDRGNNRVQVWDIESKQPVALRHELHAPDGFAVATDRYLVMMRNSSDIAAPPELSALDIATGEPSPLPKKFRAQSEAKSTFNLNSETIWVGRTNNQATIWDLANAQFHLTLPEEASPIECAVFGPDRKRLALGLTDGNIAIWDLSEVRRQLNSIGLGW
jgi:WD40 repeat protein/tRNA A-37 threonylcarbamoyl transferase component Bud32